MNKQKKTFVIIELLVFILMVVILGIYFILPRASKGKEETFAMNEVKAIIENKTYSVTLEENEIVQAWLSLLPKAYSMTELNGNEKYVYLENSLPTKSYAPEHIEKGDLMLYGDDCLVVFYKSFDTSYSYTKIGHIEGLDDLGDGNITIQFEK